MLTDNTKRHLQGWALFAPAAILLIAFTHYPTVATFFNSLFSNSSIIRPKRFIGLDAYQDMASDPVFWKVFVNNMWLALGTIPTSIGLAIIMALVVNKAVPGRGLLRMAYFTPTMLPMIAVREHLAILLRSTNRTNRPGLSRFWCVFDQLAR